MKVSSRPTGTLQVCDRCPTRTFQTELEALEHVEETGHPIRPLLEVRGEDHDA